MKCMTSRRKTENLLAKVSANDNSRGIYSIPQSTTQGVMTPAADSMKRPTPESNLHRRQIKRRSFKTEGEGLDIFQLNQPHMDLRRLRSCRSAVGWKGDRALGDGYYTPMLTAKQRRSRSLTLSQANTEDSSIYGVASEGQLHTLNHKQGEQDKIKSNILDGHIIRHRQ